jgi:hypothetical protein
MSITLFDISLTQVNEDHSSYWKGQDKNLISTLNMKLGIVVGFSVIVGQYNCIIRCGEQLHLAVWDSYYPSSPGSKVHEETTFRSEGAWNLQKKIFRSPEDRDYVLEWVKENTGWGGKNGYY